MKNKNWLVLVAGLALTAAAPALLRADYHVEKRLALEPGGRFVIESGAGSVTIRGTSGSGARVVIDCNRDDLEEIFDLRFESSPGLVRVTARKKSWGSIHNLRLHFDVEVPRETATDVKTGGGSVDVSNLSSESVLKTSGGSIRVSDLSAHLDAYTSGGSIHLTDVAGNARVDTSGGSIQASRLGGALDARTSGGSISVADVKGDLSAHTSGGPIKVLNAGGRVQAETSGGGVDVEFAHGNSHGGDLETSGGGVRVALDPASNLNLVASASGGGVRMHEISVLATGTMSPSHLEGKIGSGGPTLRVHSDGGGVTIEAR